MRNQPLISIIIPIYNKKEEYVVSCIKSVLNQTYANIEVLAINDGSTDKYNKIQETFTNNNFHFYSKNHTGVSDTRNLGINLAKGSYIMFLDADDWLDKECCKKIIDSCSSSRPDLICFSYIKEYTSRKENVKLNKDNIYSMPIIGSSCMKLYKTAIIKNKLFNCDLENGEDIEFNFRVFKEIQTYRVFQETFYHYRITKESAVRRYNPSIKENYSKTINEIRKNIDPKSIIERKAYINFLGIVYLMILLNGVFAKKNRSTRGELKKLGTANFTNELFDNTRYLDLPVTRKIPIILGKYHMYFLLSLTILFKKKLDE